MMVNEIQDHLMQTIIPFWKNLRDNEYGGYYGYMTYDLAVDKKAVKGCILNSRIMWFFSNAYTLLKDESLLDEAKHAYEFLKNCCLDRVNGGIFWSIQYDGKPEDTTKHTYNQAFAIYALSSYYEASGDEEALSIAKELYHIVENKYLHIYYPNKNYLNQCYSKPNYNNYQNNSWFHLQFVLLFDYLYLLKYTKHNHNCNQTIHLNLFDCQFEYSNFETYE